MLNPRDELEPARLFAGFEAFRGLVLAVSGGPDSIALMRLAASWREAGACVALHVATVDHGLRAESGVEAEQVGQWAGALGLPHDILRWRGEKPKSGVQERARQARYDLLFAHARTIGAEAVVTAHHADDQWETILIRLARGSGLSGLAGMARDQLLPGGRVLRPLLGLRKQALIDYCLNEDQTFLEDPSNADQAYDRARWRAAAPGLQALGLTPARLERFAARAQKADESLDWAANDLFRRTKMPESHVYHLKHAADAPEALWERFLALALAQVAGAPPARLERLELFARKLREAVARETLFRGTLGGCAARLDENGVLTLLQENNRRRGFSVAATEAREAEITELSPD